MPDPAVFSRRSAQVFYTAVNGWLLSHEYFGMVTAPDRGLTSRRVLPRRCSGRVFLAGCGIAVLFSLPALHLVAPPIGTSLVVHVVKGVAKSCED